MTLLTFLSPHLSSYCFNIEQTAFRFQICIHLKSGEINENLVLSITKINSQNEISVYLRDKNIFGNDSYILNRFSTLINFDIENLTDNLEFDKFCELTKQYVILNS
jgi:hypothetical protein